MSKYTLKFPFTNAGGQHIETIEMRRLKRSDLKAAVQFSKDDVDQEDFLLARLSGLTMEDIGQRLCCTNQPQVELPQSPDGFIPCGPFAACPVL